MLTRGMNRGLKLSTITIFLGITITALWSHIRPTPNGIWTNVFVSYWPVWAVCGLVLFTLVGATSRSTDLDWQFLTIVGSLIVSALGSLSLTWGVPYRQDSWMHLGMIRGAPITLTPAENPYPSFHIGILSVADILGVDTIHVLVPSAVIIATLSVGLLAVVLRRLPCSKTAQQRAFLVGLPTLAFSWVARPFIFVVPFVLLLMWAVFNESRPRTRLFIVAWVVIAPFYHPFLIAPFFALIGGYILVRLASLSTIETFLTDRLQTARTGNYLAVCVLMGVIGIAELTLYTDVGLNIIVRTAAAYVVGGSSSHAQAAASGSGKFAFLSNPSALIEALTRLSFIAMISLSAAVGAVSMLYRKHVSKQYLMIVTAAGGTLAVFMAVFLFGEALNITRILIVGAFLLLPAATWGFEHRRGIGTVLVVCALISGMALTYPSPLVGKSGQSASNHEVAGVKWLDSYRGEQEIVPSTMTIWIAAAEDGLDAQWRWPISGTRAGTGGYAWQTNRLNVPVVVEDVTIAAARQTARETGNRSAINELQSFKTRANRVYSNGGSEVFRW